MAAPSSAALDVIHVTRATTAGVRRHVIDLMLGLHDLGIRQGLIYSPDEADQAFWAGWERLEALGVAGFPVPMTREVNARADAAAGRELLRIVRQTKPHILHLHSSKAGGIGRLAAVWLSGVRVVYSPHASAANLASIYSTIERFLGRIRTDRLIAVSASERAELATLGYVPSNKLVQVDCGISAAEVEQGASEHPAVPLPKGRIVVAVGRMNEQKNPEFLVEVSRELLPHFPDLHFVWVGDGEHREDVEQLLQEAGIRGRWTLTGWVANPFPFMRHATVFTLPSRYESFGYVTLEAMVLGKPVVSTDITGSRDLVVSGETGYLIPPGDSHAFAVAVARILRDPEHAAVLGAASAQRARLFSRERMAQGVLDVYRSLGLRAEETSPITSISFSAE